MRVQIGRIFGIVFKKATLGSHSIKIFNDKSDSLHNFQEGIEGKRAVSYFVIVCVSVTTTQA